MVRSRRVRRVACNTHPPLDKSPGRVLAHVENGPLVQLLGQKVDDRSYRAVEAGESLHGVGLLRRRGEFLRERPVGRVGCESDDVEDVAARDGEGERVRVGAEVHVSGLCPLGAEDGFGEGHGHEAAEGVFVGVGWGIRA